MQKAAWEVYLKRWRARRRLRGLRYARSADVAGVAGVDGDAPKVVLEGGEEIESRVVVSNADPRTTFLRLVDPIDLDPNFLLKMRNYRAPGVAAKINLALQACRSLAV